MRGALRWISGTTLILALFSGDASAQYGGYGWGGWGGGGGSTYGGSVARGLGYYAMGAGMYNRNTAIANSINANTVMRWNEFMFLSQMEANRREYAVMAARQKRDSASGALIYKRLRDEPTARDVERGDALNVILDQLTDPQIQSSALRLAKDPIAADAIGEVPFVHASDALTISLHQLTVADGWPIALRGEAFATVRKAYQQAIDAALKEDAEGVLTVPSAQRVRDAASKLRTALESSPPSSRAQLNEAENYVKALIAMSRMLDKPQIEPVLAELKKVKTTTLGSLLGFMHAYNLRFGVAETPAQKTVYRDLFPQLVKARDAILKDPAAGAADAQGEHPATAFFAGMHLDEVEGKPAKTGDATK